MSAVTYNGIALPYALHTDFNQRNVYDDSQTDRAYTRFDLSIQTLININYLSLYGITVANLQSYYNTMATTFSAGQIQRYIRQRLLQPRKLLSVRIAGTEMIPNNTVTGQKGTVDAKNGPQPIDCKVIQLHDVTFLVVFTLVAHYWEQDPSNNSIPAKMSPDPVLYNRYTATQEIDDRNFVTRSRTGKFIIRSDNQTGTPVDELIGKTAFLAPSKGFLRTSSSYTVSPDGLGISYAYVDKQQYRMPPKPAFKAQASVRQVSSLQNGYLRNIEARVRLEGDCKTDQGVLMTTALLIAMNRLAMGGVGKGIGHIGIVSAIQLHAELYDNVVEVVAGGINVPTKERKVKAAVGGWEFDDIVQVPNYDPNYVPNFRQLGWVPPLLQAASYHDPSLQAALNSSIGDYKTPGARIPGQAGALPETNGN